MRQSPQERAGPHVTPYDIWQASYRLVQTVRYWPEGTVFVSVVDPGVGSDRRSIVAQTAAGHLIVTPDSWSKDCRSTRPARRWSHR